MSIIGVLFCTAFAIGATIQMAHKAKLHVLCPWQLDKYDITGDINDVSQECIADYNLNTHCWHSRYKQPLDGWSVNCEAVAEQYWQHRRDFDY